MTPMHDSWNPDAIAPPHRDVYWREARERSSWWLVALGVALVMLTVGGTLL